jgi:hypothetical protein
MFMSMIVNWILGKQVSCLLYHVFASSNFDLFCNLLESPKFCEKLNKLVFEIWKGISMLVLSTMFHYCWIYFWHISCDRFSIVLLIIFEVILGKLTKVKSCKDPQCKINYCILDVHMNKQNGYWLNMGDVEWIRSWA